MLFAADAIVFADVADVVGAQPEGEVVGIGGRVAHHPATAQRYDEYAEAGDIGRQLVRGMGKIMVVHVFDGHGEEMHGVHWCIRLRNKPNAQGCHMLRRHIVCIEAVCFMRIRYAFTSQLLLSLAYH